MFKLMKYMMIGAAAGAAAAVGVSAICKCCCRKSKTKRKLEKALKAAGSMISSCGCMLK